MRGRLSAAGIAIAGCPAGIRSEPHGAGRIRRRGLIETGGFNAIETTT